MIKLRADPADLWVGEAPEVVACLQSLTKQRFAADFWSERGGKNQTTKPLQSPEFLHTVDSLVRYSRYVSVRVAWTGTDAGAREVCLCRICFCTRAPDIASRG